MSALEHQQPSPDIDPQVYLKKHHIMTYVEDAITFLLERKDADPKTKPYHLLADYFESIKKGTHVLYRDYSFISQTPHNRASFIRLFWYSYSEVALKRNSMKVMEYLSLLRLLCYDFPSELVQRIAKVIFTYDAMENLVSFPDFLYTFQVIFYYKSFLECCELICADIVNGQTSLDGRGTMVVAVPSVVSRMGTDGSAQSVTHKEEEEEEEGEECKSYTPDSKLNSQLLVQAVTSVCMKLEKEPWEACPHLQVLLKLIDELGCVTFHDFVLVLSKSETVNSEIGALPCRNDMSAANTDALHSPINKQES